MRGHVAAFDEVLRQQMKRGARTWEADHRVVYRCAMRPSSLALGLFGSFVVLAGLAAQWAPSVARAEDGGAPSVGSSVKLVAVSALPPEYTAGPRIKPRITTTSFGDGAKIRTFSGWFDSARNEDCMAGVAGDGKSRCLPLSNAAFVLDGFYTDATCTKPLFVHGANSSGGCFATPSPRYAVVTGQNSACANTHRVFPIVSSAPASTAMPFHRKDSKGACYPWKGEMQGRVLQVGPEVSPSAFVEVTTTNAPG